MSNDDDSKFRKEECRWEVLDFLAARPATAHHAETIRRGLNQGHRGDWTPEEVLNALTFLQSQKLVEREPDPMGSSVYWQITAAGTLASERRELP